MKISDFDKLEKKLNGQNFHESYGNINKVMTGLSYFGHIASIFLAFFMLKKILLGVMDNEIIVYIVTVIILSAIELLKRDIFHKFSVLYLKLRSFTKDVLPLFFLSITIIGISFYSSIKGASEYSDLADKIEQTKIDNNKSYEDSLTKSFTAKEIKPFEIEIKEEKELFKSKDEKLDILKSKTKLSKDERVTRDDLKLEKKESDDRISVLEQKINEKKESLKSLIQKHHLESEKETKKKKNDNSSNSIAFILFSTLIEISILAGVYFNDYYDVRSYREKRSQLEKDPGFQKWKLYNQMLEVIYTEETKINQKLPSNKGIIDMCKLNDIIVLPKDVTEFLKIMASMGIIKVSGSTRYINKLRDQSFETLSNHFNIV
jgi:hypothetical protein